MKNKKSIIIISISIIILFVVILGVYFLLNKQSKSNMQINLDTKTLENLKIFNKNLDDYYMQTWDNNKFLSSYSYLVKNDGTEVTLDDIEKSLNYEVPEDLKDVSIHFVKPKALKPYLKDKILDDDQEVLTVYSALPVEGGMYISSKFDEGGFLSEKEYKQFVMEHSWEHGKIKNPLKDDKEYRAILKAVTKKDKSLKGGNVKYIACDDKYAMIVISSKDDPAYIKQYALQKNKYNSYKVIIEDLQAKDNKIFVNYAYTDFELSMLPPYEIYKYNNITSDSSYVIDLLKQSGKINNDEEVVYSCSADNFYYLEFKSNLKLLLYVNEDGKIDIYEVDNFKTALSQMTKLEDNPPVFILNFE